MSPVTIAWPLQLAADGSLATVPQDSPADIGQSVELLITTEIGGRIDEPDYGMRDPAFTVPDQSAISSALAQWEPRADPAVTVGVVDGTSRVRAVGITETGR